MSKDRTILVNRIRCRSCGDVIVSDDVHDMVWCKCGTVAVDGGTAYLRRAWRGDNPEAYDELSEFEYPEPALMHEPQGKQ